MNRTELDSDMPVDAWQITFFKCVMGLCFFYKAETKRVCGGKGGGGLHALQYSDRVFPTVRSRRGDESYSIVAQLAASRAEPVSSGRRHCWSLGTAACALTTGAERAPLPGRGLVVCRLDGGAPSDGGDTDMDRSTTDRWTPVFWPVWVLHDPGGRAGVTDRYGW